MDLRNISWNVGILVGMGGVCALVVGLALSANAVAAAPVVFNAGLFVIVLTLATAASAIRMDLRRPALAAGLAGGVSGFVVGVTEPFLVIASAAGLIGAAIATRHPRASICLMLVPAIAGWMALPEVYSIPARILLGAALVLLVHLAWPRPVGDRSSLESGSEIEFRELSD